MQSTPISQTEIDARVGGRVDELLELRGGGLFLLAEPVSPEHAFATGFAEWKAKQPPRYTRETWERFWSTANALLGYDHTALLSAPDTARIGESMSVDGWVRLLARGGFGPVDVLLRDADQVVLAALKPEVS